MGVSDVAASVAARTVYACMGEEVTEVPYPSALQNCRPSGSCTSALAGAVGGVDPERSLLRHVRHLVPHRPTALAHCAQGLALTVGTLAQMDDISSLLLLGTGVDARASSIQLPSDERNQRGFGLGFWVYA